MAVYLGEFPVYTIMMMVDGQVAPF
ncbi:hypothetical protein ACHAXR_010369 [Thalassiosira sp. AJA248-18]